MFRALSDFHFIADYSLIVILLKRNYRNEFRIYFVHLNMIFLKMLGYDGFFACFAASL